MGGFSCLFDSSNIIQINYSPYHKRGYGKLLQWVSTEVIVKYKEVAVFSIKSAAWWLGGGGWVGGVMSKSKECLCNSAAFYLVQQADDVHQFLNGGVCGE